MRFLIDTNVLISSEPTRQGDVEAVTDTSLELARRASGDHQLLVHPTVSDEIANDPDDERRRLRQTVRQRYPTLEQPPPVQPEIFAALGSPPRGSHDWYDHQLLACVVGDAVHGLITQDGGIHRKARRLGIEDRVYTVADAVATLGQLSAQPPEFVPSVDRRPLHSISLADPFFDSLKADYPGFEEWYRNAARDGRDAFVVDGPKGQIAGLCILKGPDPEIGVGRRPAKVSTFKVAEEFKGSRYGELLLKVLFRTTAGAFDVLWLTVFAKQAELICTAHGDRGTRSGRPASMGASPLVTPRRRTCTSTWIAWRGWATGICSCGRSRPRGTRSTPWCSPPTIRPAPRSCDGPKSATASGRCPTRSSMFRNHDPHTKTSTAVGETSSRSSFHPGWSSTSRERT